MDGFRRWLILAIMCLCSFGRANGSATAVPIVPNDSLVIARVLTVREDAPDTRPMWNLELLILASRDVEGLPNFTRDRVGQVIWTQTYENAGQLQTPSLISAHVELRGDEHGSAFWTSAIQPMAGHYLPLLLADASVPASGLRDASPGVEHQVALMPPYPGLIATLRQRGTPLSSVLPDMVFARRKKINRPRGLSRQPDGTTRVLALLVEFVDNPATVDTAFFDNLLFEPPPAASVRDYYDEVSYGALDLVTVNLPSQMGWQMAERPYNGAGGYINADGITGTADDYGLGDFPHNAQGLVWDLVGLVDPLVDFSRYDNDGDGVVDTLIVIHAGPAAELTGDPNYAWSHAWELPDGGQSADGVIIEPYTLEPEYWREPGDLTIGVFTHELGHSLFNLPDLYDTDYSSHGVGHWSLMGYGAWNGDLGDTPAHPGAWSRIQMGFNTPVVVADNLDSASIPRVEDNPPPAPTIYRLWSEGGGNDEYYLVENRQRVGYDAALRGAGLLIWHVDETVESNAAECTSVNLCAGRCADAHYKVALVQADGSLNLEMGNNLGDAGDPFPGGAGNTTFDPFGVPGSGSWYGCSEGRVAVKDISPASSVMTGSLQVHVPVDTRQLELHRGGNLVALPLAPYNPGVPDIVSPLVDSGRLRRIYALDACDSGDPWKVYDPHAPDFVNDLDTIDETMGVWVSMAEGAAWEVAGITPTNTSIPLCPGWNLVGYPAEQRRPVTEVLAPIAGRYDRVFAFEAGDPEDPWKVYDPGVPDFANDLAEFQPGFGYWIKIKDDVQDRIDLPIGE